MKEKFGEEIEKQEITIRDVIASKRKGGAGIRIRMQAIVGKSTQEGSVLEIGDEQLIKKYKEFSQSSRRSFGRDVNHVFRLLKSQSESDKKFALDYMEHIEGIVIDLEKEKRNSDLEQTIRGLIGGEGFDDTTWLWSLLPSLHKKLLEAKIEPKEAIGKELSWIKSAAIKINNLGGEHAPNIQKNLYLPGLEKYNDNKVYDPRDRRGFTLREPGDISYQFAEQEAERIIAEHSEIFGEL